MQTDTGNNKDQRIQQEQNIKESLSKIKRKILVMSGKGGVGKSSTSVNIAVGLADSGYKVGLMDVDLHGPSIPQMLGLKKVCEFSPEQVHQKRNDTVTFSDNKIVPAQYSENLSVVSIECLLDDNDSAVIWRGPLKISAIKQFISDVLWDELDFLIIDSPPGTGDEPLTIAQTITDVEAVIVTTPQTVSIRDVRKSINFCKHVNMKIIGLIENMSGFVCSDCGKKTNIFDSGGGIKAAKEMDISFIGKIPIIPEIVQACDKGIPAIRKSETLQESFAEILEIITGKKQYLKLENNYHI